jgi:signal transduction histidine kinase
MRKPLGSEGVLHKRRRRIATMTVAYITLSVFCLAEAFGWSTLGSTLIGLGQAGRNVAELIAVLLGPPAFLFWGIRAWPLYVLFTLLVIVAVSFSVRGSAKERAALKLVAVLIWLAAGACSYALAT